MSENLSRVVGRLLQKNKRLEQKKARQEKAEQEKKQKKKRVQPPVNQKDSVFAKPLLGVYAIASINRRISRKLFILYTIATLPKPTIEDVFTVTEIPKSTISRLMSDMRNEDGINIVFLRKTPKDSPSLTRGKEGYYVIESWGQLNQDEFLATFEQEAHGLVSPKSR